MNTFEWTWEKPNEIFDNMSIAFHNEAMFLNVLLCLKLLIETLKL